MKSAKKPFWHSPSVLFLHDERQKGFDKVMRNLAFDIDFNYSEKAQYLDEEREKALLTLA